MAAIFHTYKHNIIDAIDLNFVKSVTALKSVIDLKAQANFINVDDTDYEDPEDPIGASTFTFDNQSKAYFVQGSIRPSFVNSMFFQNLEFALRYSKMETPEGALWETSQ